MSNRLKFETSPYLLQHKDNPVEWYPWCEEAFNRAKAEDKPVFLSIGYSTCHWCHVMAHESFEDEEIAEILNQYFVSIKVDKEERPDIDNVYMSVCQAFTGSGGWPTSIFMTPEQKPFFAGTYFPKTGWGGAFGLKELLLAIHEQWVTDRHSLLQQSKQIIAHLNKTNSVNITADASIIHTAIEHYRKNYDGKFGGFGRAPKFPTPHNILFLLSFYERYKNQDVLKMAEHTLAQMYRGGIFDHIGFGFCRYSTDEKFLVPHFEKMLYDNALLILAYCKAYSVTKKQLYIEVAEKIADFVFREMTSPEGGFYSALDADSEGEEGKFYLFTSKEITDLLGEKEGEKFNLRYDITLKGNFEGKNIPNLLKSKGEDKTFDKYFPELRDYRKNRFHLHLDDKVLTSWNSLMIGAMCELYLNTQKAVYLDVAKKADEFIQKNLLEEESLFVSFRDGKRGVKGFLDDYAAYIFSQIHLYRATLERRYLNRTRVLCDKVMSDFGDESDGFFLYGKDSEELILKPKETYDGAIPSGNSLMAYNLVKLSIITSDEKYIKETEKQLAFIAGDAISYPPGYAMFLTALLEYYEPAVKVTVVPDKFFNKDEFLNTVTPDTTVILLEKPTEQYPLINNKTTYYVCGKRSCLPPTNELKI